MSHSEFDTHWLNHRFSFDEAARNRQVERAALQHLAAHSSLHLLDIGSGTGANFLHFFEQLDRPQHWYLLDHDPRLLAASLHRIATYAQEKNYPHQRRGAQLLLHLGPHEVRVHTLSGSFEQLETLVDLSRLDLVLASAFFDLFRADQLLTLLDKLGRAKLAFLFTLSYRSMIFDPSTPTDERMVQYYEAHMQRPQATGAAMGPHCSRHLRDWLLEGTFDFVEGESAWQIGPTDFTMLHYLLGFMRTAIAELEVGDDGAVPSEQWWRERTEAVHSARLGLVVRHWDYFAAPRPETGVSS